MSVLDLHLGIDFGTRYTKTCIRDIGREQSWVVRSGRAESYLDEALILSQVGITTQGKIIAGLTQYEWQKQTESFALKIDYIKMRLAHLDISQDNSQWYSPQIQGLQEYDLPLEEILENICAFFLFKVIQRSQAWFTESQKNLFKNMTVEWGASIGVPVAYCDSPALTRFKKVLGLAWCLNEESQLDEESQLGDSLNYVNSKLMQLKRNIDLEQIPCYAIPEIAAAVSSFTNSRQAKQGVYTFFDVGGGTIEGVAFDFCPDNNGQKKIDFYAALVEPLGVNSIAKKVVEQFQAVQESSVEKSILFKGESILRLIAKLSSEYIVSSKRPGWHIANKHQAIYELVENSLNHNHLNTFFVQNLILFQRWIHTQVAQVFTQCFQRLEYSGQSFLFLSGGGKESDYYKDTINSTYEVFRLKLRQIPRYQYLEVPVPSDCKMGKLQNKNFHRFTVAYGLSIPDYDSLKPRLPNEFPDLPREESVPYPPPETALEVK